MARKHNGHHYVQFIVVGQCPCKYSRLNRAATDNKRILCRTVDIAGSKEKTEWKLRCLYGLLKGLHPTSALVAVSTAMQQFDLYNKTRNETTLAHVASQEPTNNKVGVSCNCKKGCGTQRCRCCEWSKVLYSYCHNTDYDCGNLKSLTERAEISLMPRESWEVLDRLFRGWRRGPECQWGCCCCCC